MSQKISLRVGYEGESLAFHLRMISMAEEQRYTQRFIDIVDSDPETKSEKEYQILVDAISNWSVEVPTKKDVAGKDEPIAEGTPSEAIRRYFAERSDEKERILNTAYMSFKARLAPSVSFL
jgi:hypothetical protein